MIYLLYFCMLFAGILVYFKIADRYNIIDRPNERSSHTEVTIRGGGIIFLIAAAIIWVLYPGYWMVMLGLFVIGTISFIDDRINLSNKIRLFFHLVAVSLLFASLELFKVPLYLLALLYIFVIGTVNAYNFMDGINGITGIYSLVVLGSLQYVNYRFNNFIEPDLIWLPILSCLVFLFFNFRKKAKCFAGDVGSIAVAFWIIYLLIKLILRTENYAYIFFLTVYGMDAVLTIVHRIILKQNIFEAHRLHFYQVLANERKMPHLCVSLIYGLTQMLVIALVINSNLSFGYLAVICIFPLLLLYVYMKPKLMKAST